MSISDVISYDPETGDFRWKVRVSGRQMNRTPGWLHGGYRRIELLGVVYQAHNLAWFLHHGVWPDFDLDHIDLDGANNKLANLRLATHAQNCANRRRPSTNTSGHKGVSFHKASGKWQASIKVNKKAIHLGLFATRDGAAEAYWNAAQRKFGDFARVA